MLSYPKAKEMSIVVSRFCFLWEFVFLWGSERATGLFFWNSSVPPFCNWIIQDQESINQSINRQTLRRWQKILRLLLWHNNPTRIIHHNYKNSKRKTSLEWHFFQKSWKTTEILFAQDQKSKTFLLTGRRPDDNITRVVRELSFGVMPPLR